LDLRGRALALAAALAIAAAAAAGCDCARVQQQLFVDMADPELQALLDACQSHQAAPGESCAPVTSYPVIDCGCLPLCRRMLQIADQFSGIDSIETCHYLPARTTTTTTPAPPPGVIVTYRPTTCQ
jgi:hypothetical protein